MQKGIQVCLDYGVAGDFYKVGNCHEGVLLDEGAQHLAADVHVQGGTGIAIQGLLYLGALILGQVLITGFTQQSFGLGEFPVEFCS